jgi:hypothetical protein
MSRIILYDVIYNVEVAETIRENLQK